MRALLFAVVLAPAAAAAAKDTRPPKLEHEACVTYESGQDYYITVRIADESALFEPKVAYRTGGGRKWTNVELLFDEPSGYHVAVVPGRLLTGALEYVIEVYDVQGNGPSRVGTPGKPMQVRVGRTKSPCASPPEPPPPPLPIAPTAPQPRAEPAPEPKPEVITARPEVTPDPLAVAATEPAATGCDAADAPFYCQPWLWIVAGSVVVLAGAGTAAYVVCCTGEKDQPPPDRARLVIDNGPRPPVQ